VSPSESDLPVTAPLASFGCPTLLLCLGAVLACSTTPAGGQRLTAQDSTAIESVRAAYVRAWLADDTSAVLATLDSGAVLLPPGRVPVEGREAIRAFWWPTDGSHTTITAFEWTLDELEGTARLAFSRGISTVAWRYEKDSVRSEQTTRSTNLTILARGPDGRWRILRQMWGPPLPG
jgi:ketosteroid isomerase-like protein